MLLRKLPIFFQNMSDIEPDDSVSGINTAVSICGTENSTALSSKKRSRRSDVWDHFSIHQPGRSAKCNYCRGETGVIKIVNGGTTSLKNHLKNHHNAILNGKLGPKQQRLEDVVLRKPKSDAEITRLLIRWIILRNHAFTEVEALSFRDLIEALNPHYKVMCAKTLKGNILNRFNNQQAKLRIMLDQLDSRVSFTLDAWTAPNNTAYLGMTAHYIDSEWRMVALTMDFVPLSGSHTGVNLYAAFKNTLEQLNLKHKVLGVTLDNASNNNTFIEELHRDEDTSFDDFHHIRCFAHVLNLAAQAALSVISKELEGLRLCVKKMRASTQLMEEFRSLSCNQKQLKPMLDVCTRWNSTCDMIERSLKLKEAFTIFAMRHSPEFMVNEHSWNRLKQVKEYLEPFRKATEASCMEKYPTLSIVVPWYNSLMDHLDLWMREKTTPGDLLHNSVVAASAKLKDYYDVTSHCYTIATVLHPRLNMGFYKSTDPDTVSEIEISRIIRNAYQDYRHNQPDTSEIVAATTYSQLPTSFIRENPRSDELDRYFDEAQPRAQTIADFLAWWKLNQHKYPNLSRMARDYLAIPGTSASSERLFSSAKHLLTDNRSCLAGSSVRACQCLKSWLMKNAIPLDE